MAPGPNWSAGEWTAALEGWPGAVGPQRVSGVDMGQAVVLALACGFQPRRPLLRWCLRWRHLQPRQTAQQLLAAGIPRGPELGQRLRMLRLEAIEAVEQRALESPRNRPASKRQSLDYGCSGPDAMTPTVLKFSSKDCGVCHRMAHYDAKVATELGAELISVMLQDTDTYRRYRKVLLAQYPHREGMGWPTYLVVSDPEGAFTIHGELKGGMPKGEFRRKLSGLLPKEDA